jgi:hypothetical protein
MKIRGTSLRYRAAQWAPAIAILCSGCSGSVDNMSSSGSGGTQAMQIGSGGAPSSTGSGGAGSNAMNVPGMGDPNNPASGCTAAPLAPRAVLVSSRQYVNALRDLLGDKAVSDEDAATEGQLDFEIVDRPLVTTASMDRTLRLAEAGAESLRGQAAKFFACSALTDSACVRTALTKVARRAWKRPPEADEMDGVMNVYDTGAAAITDDAGESAALLALEAVLVAPSSLYRTEFLGTPNGTDQALTPYERAGALAGLLLDSVPDEALLSAADDGSLMTPAGLQAQVDRLLALPRVRDHLTALLLNAYRVPKVFETAKDTSKFKEYTPALQSSMYEESRRFIDDILWQRSAALSELVSSRNTFVDGPLAAIYGVTHTGAPDAFTPVELPMTRAGLLTQASVMSVLSRTDKTSVVARGLFVRNALLCLPKIPGPPASVQAQVAMQLAQDATQQELAMHRATTSPCMNCHSQFDRFGLLLEAFDPIGRERTNTTGPIDFTGLTPLDGVINNPSELAAQLVDDKLFTTCLAQRMLAYTLSTAQDDSTACSASTLMPAFEQGGGNIKALVSAIVAQPMFSQRSTGDL